MDRQSVGCLDRQIQQWCQSWHKSGLRHLWSPLLWCQPSSLWCLKVLCKLAKCSPWPALPTSQHRQTHPCPCWTTLSTCNHLPWQSMLHLDCWQLPSGRQDPFQEERHSKQSCPHNQVLTGYHKSKRHWMRQCHCERRTLVHPCHHGLPKDCKKISKITINCLAFYLPVFVASDIDSIDVGGIVKRDEVTAHWVVKVMHWILAWVENFRTQLPTLRIWSSDNGVVRSEWHWRFRTQDCPVNTTRNGCMAAPEFIIICFEICAGLSIQTISDIPNPGTSRSKTKVRLDIDKAITYPNSLHSRMW